MDANTKKTLFQCIVNAVTAYFASASWPVPDRPAAESDLTAHITSQFRTRQLDLAALTAPAPEHLGLVTAGALTYFNENRRPGVDPRQEAERVTNFVRATLEAEGYKLPEGQAMGAGAGGGYGETAGTKGEVRNDWPPSGEGRH